MLRNFPRPVELAKRGHVSGNTLGGKERETPERRYADFVQVGHNAFEFMLDFGQMTEGGETVNYGIRVVGNPQFAKALWATLGEAICEYERAFGMIRSAEES
jgi:hypothetical protein